MRILLIYFNDNFFVLCFLITIQGLKYLENTSIFKLFYLHKMNKKIKFPAKRKFVAGDRNIKYKFAIKYSSVLVGAVVKFNVKGCKQNPSTYSKCCWKEFLVSKILMLRTSLGFYIKISKLMQILLSIRLTIKRNWL